MYEQTFAPTVMRVCRRCRQSVGAYLLSKRGLCPDCGRRAVEENLAGMRDKSSSVYGNWRANWVRGIRAAQEAIEAQTHYAREVDEQ
jgi:anaerobic ribonucleoside-triphosphate reductase